MDSSIPRHLSPTISLTPVRSRSLSQIKKLCQLSKIFLHAFCSADDLAVAVCRYADSNKDGHVLHFAAPAAFQINTVNINVCVFTGQFSAAPGFDMFVSLLIEITDRSWRYLSSPKSFCDILYAADGYPPARYISIRASSTEHSLRL